MTTKARTTTTPARRRTVNRRTKTPPPDPQARPAVAEADEQQSARSSRDAIARLYGHRSVGSRTTIESGPVDMSGDVLVIGPGATVEEIAQGHHKSLALDPQAVVDLLVAASDTYSRTQGAPKTMATVQLTFKGLAAQNKIALYKGLRTMTRLSVTDFPDNKPPQTLDVIGEFAGPREIKPKQPKLTKAELKARREERKRERANMTIEDRIRQAQADADKRIAKLKAQAEKSRELQPA